MNNPFNNPNLQQFCNQGMLFNPNFSNQNAQLGNLNGINLNNFHGLNPNVLPVEAPNNQLGLFQLVEAQLRSNPQLQMNLLNQLQAQSFATPFQLRGSCLPYMGFNPNQMMGMPNPQLLAQNQMFQGNPLMGLLGNPQLVPNNMGSGFGNAPGAAMGPNPVYRSLGLMNSEQSICSSLVQTHPNQNNGQQANGGQQFEVDHTEAKSTDNARVSSHNSAGRCSRNGPSHNRFQKSQLRDARSSRGNMKQFNKRGGRGRHNWRELKPQPTSSWEETPAVGQRPLPVNYTKMEIQLWREARKKNFPTRANMNKKGRVDENKDDDAKLRRQQLKEVLAKQAQLGVEVAEIPASYLREAEDQAPEMGNGRGVTDGRSMDRFNKKRGRGHGRENWRSNKRQKFQNKGAPASPPSSKREPSLLEKLLSADIKREKSRLLQVFRFMLLNDFFKQWPEKPLEFPIITVKDDGAIGGEIAGETGPSLVRSDSPTDLATKKALTGGLISRKEPIVAEVDYESDKDGTFCANPPGNDTMGMADGTGEQFEESEEGEITD